MARRGRASLALLATAAALAVAPASAAPVQAGFAVTIAAPDRYVPDEPITVSGQLLAVFALPVIVEVAEGVPDQQIQILVDGTVAATATTGDDGTYATTLVFDAATPHTKMLQAVAFSGSPVETRSRVVHTTIDRVLAELEVSPDAVELAPGGQAQLLAEGMWDDGRTQDLTGLVTWSSSDPGIASVADGVVSAHGPGVATITATYRGRAAHATARVL